MSGSPNPKFVTVARILRARGNKGEVSAELLTDFPDRLKSFSQLFLAGDNSAAGENEPRTVALKSFWVDRNHPGFGIFHFDGINSIGEAEKLRGLEIQIPFEQRVALPAGQYFVSDLIGCSVFGSPKDSPPVSSPPCAASEVPSHLGNVADVFFPGESQPGVPLLAVKTARGELLIPLAGDFCTRIDTVARRIEVTLPDGFLEMNEE